MAVIHECLYVVSLNAITRLVLLLMHIEARICMQKSSHFYIYLFILLRIKARKTYNNKWTSSCHFGDNTPFADYFSNLGHNSCKYNALALWIMG